MSISRANDKAANVTAELMRTYIRQKDDFQKSLILLPNCVEMSYSDGIYFGQVSNHKTRNGKGVFTY